MENVNIKLSINLQILIFLNLIMKINKIHFKFSATNLIDN